MKNFISTFFKTGRLLPLVFALFFQTFCFSQNGISWSSPIAVATGAAGNFSPRIALLPDSSLGVVWGNASKIWFSRWSGGAFSPAVQIGTGGTTPGIYEFGGLDVAASGQRIFVVFEQFQKGIFCVRSDDGGATWQPPTTVFTVPTRRGATISSISVDALGNPMVSFLYQTSSETNANVQFVRSLDGGLTFPVSTNASTPADGDFVCECCYQDILPTGGDTVFVAFRNNRSNIRDMWVTRSTDGGANFDAACDADAQDWTVNVCPFSGPRLARLAGDSLLSVWMSKTTAGLRVFGSTLHTESMEKGQEFSFSGSSTGTSFNQNHPDVAARLDTVAVVWEESGFVGTGQDIICAFSTTGAAGLKTGNLSNVSAAAGSQKFPQIAYRDGIFHLIYTDPTAGLIYRRGTVVAPSGTGETIKIDSSVQIFPNPTTDFLTIKSSQTMARVDVFSVVGRLMQSHDFADKSNLSLANLPAGVYFLKIWGKQGTMIGFERVLKN